MNNKVDLSFNMSTGLGPETAFCVLYLLWISTYLCIQLSKNKKEIQHSNLTKTKISYGNKRSNTEFCFQKVFYIF